MSVLVPGDEYLTYNSLYVGMILFYTVYVFYLE